MWDTALLLSRFSFCIYIHRTARFTGSQRKRGEAAQLTRILLPLILLEGFSAKADGGQSEAERALPPSASNAAVQLQRAAAPLEGRWKGTPGPPERPGRDTAASPTQSWGQTPLLTCPHPGVTSWTHSQAGAVLRHAEPPTQTPSGAARPSPREVLVFQKPFPITAASFRACGEPGGEGPGQGGLGPVWGRWTPVAALWQRSSSASPSSAPSHHCGSADGSSVTSLFLPPCFDPAVLIVQANPTLPALAACQDCY